MLNSFNFLKIICYIDKYVENIVTVWTRRITVKPAVHNYQYLSFLLLLCLKNKVTFEKLLKLRGGAK